MASAKLFLMHTDVGDLMKVIPFTLPATALKIALGYHRLADRNNYIAGRWLLYEYFRSMAIDFDFNKIHYSTYGKPYIRDGVHFSIAHTGRLVGLVVSDSPVGLDIEQIRDIDNVDEYGAVFKAGELEKIKQEGKDTFFRLWTSKEAVLKMTGDGIIDTATVQAIEISEHGTALLNGQQIDVRNFIYGNEFFVSVARPVTVYSDDDLTLSTAVIRESILLFEEEGIINANVC